MLTVYETKSINRAAETLFLSQPYLSKCIKEIERQIGVSLITRNSRGVVFTKAGEQFLLQARAIVDSMEKIHALAAMPSTPKEYMIHCFYSFTLAHIIQQFGQRKAPENIRIEYTETHNSQILQHLRENSASFGIFYFVSTQESIFADEFRRSGFVFHPICKDNLYAIVGKKHPLFPMTEVTPDQLKPFPLVLQKFKGNLSHEEKKDHGIYDCFKDFHVDFVPLDNNATLLFQVSNDCSAFTLGQRAFNTANPLVQYNELKYIPIKNTAFHMITGLLGKHVHVHDPIFLELLDELTTALQLPTP